MIHPLFKIKMALFDDRRFLLSHINHSFITGDDTGICEMVMLDEDVFENQHQQCLKLEGQDNENPEDRLQPAAYDLDYESELFESEQGQSYDIASDLDYICHRRRSNTAQRLDRLKKEKINQSRTKTIVWRCNSPNEDRLSAHDSPTSVNSNNNNIGASSNNKFENVFIQSKRNKSPPSKSGLTRLLEKFPSLPKNPFDEFAQFDGGMSEALPVKKINIFIAIEDKQQQQQQQQTVNEINKQEIDNDTKNQTTMIVGSPSESKSETNVTKNLSANNNNNTVQQTNNNNDTINNNINLKALQINNNNKKPKNNSGPLEVVIVSTARVQDLIGLICWQYTNEGREPKLNHDIDKYCLRIAEDNGEVDPDFTSLNPKEPLSKFNFPSLALTEKSEDRIRTNNYTTNDNNSPIINNQTYVNGCTIYTERIPSIAPSNTRLPKPSGRFDAIRQFLFRDDKL